MQERIAALEQKLQQRNQELKVMVDKYMTLYENSPDMYLSTNPHNGMIMYCNQTLCNKTGYTREEIIGQSVFFLHAEGAQRIKAQESFKKYTQKGALENLELEMQRKDKTTINVLINVNTVRDKDKKPIYSLASIKDITQIRLLEKKLEDANKNLEEKVRQRTKELELKNKELAQFAYIASHDLQEPLRTVNSFVSRLDNDYGASFDLKAQTYMYYIKQGATRMSGLIKGLLDYSRIGLQKKPNLVDSTELINKIKEDLANIITETQASFIIEDLPKVMAHEIELSVLFQNLVTNALKFRQKNVKPIIRIYSQSCDKYWKFSVEDNGIGIAPAHKEKIFGIFQRLHTKKEYDGSGIGLAHCQKIVNLYGGEIWVDSKRNKGSTFHFTIPK